MAGQNPGLCISLALARPSNMAVVAGCGLLKNLTSNPALTAVRKCSTWFTALLPRVPQRGTKPFVVPARARDDAPKQLQRPARLQARYVRRRLAQHFFRAPRPRVAWIPGLLPQVLRNE